MSIHFFNLINVVIRQQKGGRMLANFHNSLTVQKKQSEKFLVANMNDGIEYVVAIAPRLLKTQLF